MIGFAIVIPGIFIMLGSVIYGEHSMQKTFQTQYGADWQEQYAKRFGPDGLERSNKKILVAGVAIPAYALLVFFFARMLIKNINMSRSGGGRRRKHSSQKRQW
jgi:hypothetical protein